ncbi:NAD-dependent epimerase/dehydratase [Catenulispora acidiphila DSM 44928]|uniref:NAD-dependent epimerase/dehydratase n=1 Tax=Catenulispora acidiphila (strain DSM 44928 / JCM 14897 / NBRC 102108 / NRRL B-24433 / ID139908) TaxID=479433 RepID=C7PW66_CATAD|nr:SDR family oxidoreductase [Catenulispora acidiphila]ACU73314.1 NAD-dependent epimerase/dehydratase [Catenulispora acidiphila DSM 44928]
MRILIIGGSGYVGTLMLPGLATEHEIRVLDLVPPQGDHEHVAGSATDPAALAAALEGMDAVVHGAMGRRSESHWPHPDVASAFEVNVASVYATLEAAHAAGVRRAVLIGSLSVFDEGQLIERQVDEETAPDAADVYGVTKRLAEQVGRIAAEAHGMTVTVLRLAFPTPDDVWPRWALPVVDEPIEIRRADGSLVPALAGSDLSAAVSAALSRDDGGYDVFHIVGADDSGRGWSTAKARDALGWVARRRYQG